jgi:hypothetical protein
MAMLLLIVLLVFTLLGRLKKTRVTLSAVSLVSLIYAGYTISTITEPLHEALINTLGFLVLFMDISNMITINLGIGYWLTLTAAGLLLLAKTLHNLIYGSNTHF